MAMNDTSDSVTANKVVTITYRITDDSGAVVELNDAPVEYIHGIPNPVFEKIEQALEGKSVGETVTVELPPADGFGPHLEELTFTDNLENVPPEFRFVGARPSFQNQDGETREFVVSKIEDGKLTVDGNHPFAGKTVTFHILVLGVRDATASELKNGEPIVASSDLLQ